MARGSQTAQQGASAGLAQNQALSNTAAAGYSALAPQLQAQAMNPQGFGATNLARIKTENEQAAGGANAGATGEASLIEGRTKNAGGLGMALSKSARDIGKGLTSANLSANLANEGLKEQQREGALKGEEGLYGTNLAGAGAALGAVAPNVNADVNAKDASWNWSKYLLAPILSAAGGAATGGFAKGGAFAGG